MSSRRLRAFKRWVRSQGINCSNALGFVDGDDGISVTALCDLKEGDLVATIPKSSCLTIKTSAAAKMIEEAGLSGSLGLSFALMYEKSLGSDSFWDGYLQVLPQRESVPLVWSLEEVDSLLLGTELHKIVKEDRTFLHEDWRECLLPLVESGPLKLNPDNFGVEQYFAAKSLVASRSFEIDDYHGFGMVPLADLFNHKTGAENVHFTSNSSLFESEDDKSSENEDECYNIDEDMPLDENLIPVSSAAEDNHTDLEMIVVKEVREGNEVFNTYGSMGNAALLHRYGFTESDNPFDIVNIDIDLVEQLMSSSFSKRYCRSRLSLWRKLGYAGCISQNSEYFEISHDGEPQVELLALLYILFLPEEAYQNLSNAISLVGNADGTINVLLRAKSCGTGLPLGSDEVKVLLLSDSVCAALLSLADVRETFYGSNSLKDDMKELSKCSQSRDKKVYHSLVLRTSERMILKRLRTYALRRGRVRNVKRKPEA